MSEFKRLQDMAARLNETSEKLDVIQASIEELAAELEPTEPVSARMLSKIVTEDLRAAQNQFLLEGRHNLRVQGERVTFQDVMADGGNSPSTDHPPRKTLWSGDN